MTKYIVRCIFNGTKLDFAFSARTPENALLKTCKSKLGRKADVWIVYERKTNSLVLAVRRP